MCQRDNSWNGSDRRYRASQVGSRPRWFEVSTLHQRPDANLREDGGLAAHGADTAPREDDSRLTVDTAVAVDINDDDGSEGTAVLNVTMDMEPGQGAVSRDG